MKETFFVLQNNSYSLSNKIRVHVIDKSNTKNRGSGVKWDAGRNEKQLIEFAWLYSRTTYESCIISNSCQLRKFSHKLYILGHLFCDIHYIAIIDFGLRKLLQPFLYLFLYLLFVKRKKGIACSTLSNQQKVSTKIKSISKIWHIKFLWFNLRKATPQYAIPSAYWETRFF